MTSCPRRLLAALLAGLLLMACVEAPAALAENTVAFTIEEEQITESSGLAMDPGGERYWTVNDSGDTGRVFALGPKGRLHGSFDYGVQPVDVEAVAMHNDTLYVADIGDNKANRDFVTVYIFENPSPSGLSVTYKAYDFAYPDGPRDAEALVIDGNGRLYLISKEAKGGIYAAPSEPTRVSVNELERVGDAPAYVTDGVYLADGDQFALRTYVSVVVLDAFGYDTVARAGLPLQRQGESIALSLDGEKLLVGSEGKKSQVLAVPIPTKKEDVAKGGPKPPSTKAPTPTPTEPADAETSAAANGAGDSRSRQGTFVAVGLAALMAVVAGIVVFVAKPRG